MTEIQIPNTVVDSFGEPEAWAVTIIDTANPEVTNWRAVGYTGALRHLEAEISKKGKDPRSGEWRLFEFDDENCDLLACGFVDAEDTDLTGLRVVMVVAKGLLDA